MKQKTQSKKKHEWQEISKSKRNNRFLFPSITIVKGKNIVFNKPFVKKYFKKSSYVRVYFNEKRRQIGIKLADDSFQNAYKVSILKSNGIGVLRPRRLFKFYNIEINEKFHIKAIKDSKVDMFVIDLKEEGK